MGGGGGGGMKNTIRCCISCILPCGVLDVVRIVHSDGRVEEISGTVRASEIMKLHPKHVLKKPSSAFYYDTDAVSPARPQIIIVPPDAELQRGKIYFLMSAPPDKLQQTTPSRSSRKKRRGYRNNSNSGSYGAAAGGIQFAADLVMSDRYLSEILSEKLSSLKQDYERRGRIGIWRPHLESISETPTSESSSSSSSSKKLPM